MNANDSGATSLLLVLILLLIVLSMPVTAGEEEAVVTAKRFDYPITYKNDNAKLVVTVNGTEVVVACPQHRWDNTQVGDRVVVQRRKSLLAGELVEVRLKEDD